MEDVVSILPRHFIEQFFGMNIKHPWELMAAIIGLLQM